jgi:hypothetical protein
MLLNHWRQSNRRFGLWILWQTTSRLQILTRRLTSVCMTKSRSDTYDSKCLLEQNYGMYCTYHCTTNKFRNTTTNMVTNCCAAQKSATAAQSPQSIKIDRCYVGFNKIKENNRKCGAVCILLPTLKCVWFMWPTIVDCCAHIANYIYFKHIVQRWPFLHKSWILLPG